MAFIINHSHCRSKSLCVVGVANRCFTLYFAFLDELKLCMLQLKTLDIEAYDEIEKAKDKEDELWNIMSDVIVAEDTLHSTFDKTKEGRAAFDKSVTTINAALVFETFHLEIIELEGKEGLVTFTRDGTTFLPEIQLLTVRDTENATSKQAASIVIEIAVVLILMAEVNDPLSRERLKQVIEELEPYMARLSDALRNLAFIWKNNSDTKARAVSLLTFLKQIYHDRVLIKCIQLILANLGWFQRAQALMRINFFFHRNCRQPESILSRIEKILESKAAGKFVKKIVNLVKISECQSKLDPSYIL